MTAANFYAVGFAVCSPLEEHPDGTFAWAIAGKCRKLVFLASGWVGAFFKIYPELFPAYPRGSVAGYHRQHFFDLTGSYTIRFPTFSGPKLMQTYRKVLLQRFGIQLRKNWPYIPPSQTFCFVRVVFISNSGREYNDFWIINFNIQTVLYSRPE